MPTADHLLLLLLSYLLYVVSETAVITELESEEENPPTTERAIMVNESENSRSSTTLGLKIIDEPESGSSDIISSTTRPRTRTTHGRFRKITPPGCRKYSVSEKYRMLEGVGARNQLYMAETPDEASIGFVPPEPITRYTTFSADTSEPDGFAPFCSRECQMIKTTLEKALKERKKPKPVPETEPFTRMRVMPLRAPSVPLGDAGPIEVDEVDFVLAGKGKVCSLEKFVPLGNCTEPGEEISWAHEQLCSMCRGIYMLSENCFPTFFNAVLCNQQETGCIFDSFSDRAHGLCRSETLSLRVLRNRGDSVCEDWVIQQIELPVACQCLLSKGSWLRSHPVRGL